jgi:hypothetical protein
MNTMLRKLALGIALLTAGLLVGCGVSTMEPDGGSREQTYTGKSGSNGYPGNSAQSNDAESPALSSSTEQKYSGTEEREPVTESKADTPAAPATAK